MLANRFVIYYYLREMFNIFKKSELKTIDKNIVEEKIENFISEGVTNNENDVIVSLTSFPERMYEIHYTLYSLLNQSVKPAKVVLWLAKDQFPNYEEDIPQKVLDLRKNGLDIEWTDNIYSYKKLIPTLSKYPDRIIVTADDDVYYEEDWLKKLLDAYGENKDCVVCHRAHRLKLDKNGIAPYKKWDKKIKNTNPSYKNFFTGIGGVLYPPHSLFKDVLNEKLFTELAPKADDVWFWAMAVLNNTKICVAKNCIKEMTYINPERERGLTNEITLFSQNKKGGNDLQLKQIINHYPQILDLLKS